SSPPYGSGDRSRSRLTARFQVRPPENTTFVSLPAGGASETVSPDGSRLAFSATDASGKTQLWVRSLDAPVAQPLADTEGAFFPFWSPDSQYIGYFVPGKMKRIVATGGPTLTVCEIVGEPRGGTWNRRGVILFSQLRLESTTEGSVIWQVRADGGKPKAVTRFEQSREEPIHRWPTFLPDGDHFLFMMSGQPYAPSSRIWLGSVESGAIKPLVASETSALYASGFLLYTQEGTVVGQPFDLTRFALHGEVVPVTTQIARNPFSTHGPFSASETGVMTYQAGQSALSRF